MFVYDIWTGNLMNILSIRNLQKVIFFDFMFYNLFNSPTIIN